jgi:hypothetical protein
MIIPVVLSGGSGTRLWPLSREQFPKQLLPLTGGGETMLQATVARTAGLPGIGAPVVVCNESHRFMVAEQLRGFEPPPQAIVLELSSFQLESTATLSPDAAAMLNLSEDHLDRYDGLAGYGAAKARLQGDGISGKLHLHARSIELPHPSGDGMLKVKADLPEHMRKTWAFFGFDADARIDPFPRD